MKKILFILPMVALLGAGCNSSQYTSDIGVVNKNPQPTSPTSTTTPQAQFNIVYNNSSIELDTFNGTLSNLYHEPSQPVKFILSAPQIQDIQNKINTLNLFGGNSGSLVYNKGIQINPCYVVHLTATIGAEKKEASWNCASLTTNEKQFDDYINSIIVTNPQYKNLPADTKGRPL